MPALSTLVKPSRLAAKSPSGYQRFVSSSSRMPSQPLSAQALRTASAVSRSARRSSSASLLLRRDKISNSSSYSMPTSGARARLAGSTSSSAISRGEARMVQQVAFTASGTPFASRMSPRGAGTTVSRSCWPLARPA